MDDENKKPPINNDDDSLKLPSAPEEIKALHDDFYQSDDINLVKDGARRNAIQRALENNFFTIEADRLQELNEDEMKELEDLIPSLQQAMKRGTNGKIISLDDYNAINKRIMELIKGGK